MRGAFVRVHRDGSWQSIDIDALTDEELDAFAAAQPSNGWKWGKFLDVESLDNSP